MQIADVRRMLVGTIVRPVTETGSGRARVEAVYAYVIAHEDGAVVLDTGIGRADDETEAWYRPRRLDLATALRDSAGIDPEDVRLIVNCHLHFDHCGGNSRFAGTPIICQRSELSAAHVPDYTIVDLVDFPGARYEQLDGEAEVLAGVHVIPTPGHVPGHQSIVVECADGSIVLAGQSHDMASEWSADVLAARALDLGYQPPLPDYPGWIDRLLQFDPRQVCFAHDGAVWVPGISGVI